MADQGKWWKLWASSLDDPDLENLSIHEWFCWARFGTLLKKHGKRGKIRLTPPAASIIKMFRLASFDDVIAMIKRFPNYRIEEAINVTVNETNAFASFNVKCLNWHKYQGDFSSDRVRKYRNKSRDIGNGVIFSHVTRQEEKRREEKRRDPPNPHLASPKSTSKVNDLRLPEIPEGERMSTQEMEAIRKANMEGEVAQEPAATGAMEDVF